VASKKANTATSIENKMTAESTVKACPQTHIYAAQVPETGQTCGLATLVVTATQQ